MSDPAPAPATPPTDPTIGAGITDATYQWVVKLFAGTISLVFVMITGVMCFRVILDGDSTITQEITSQLVSMVPWIAGSLVAAIVGTKGIASLIASKLS